MNIVMVFVLLLNAISQRGLLYTIYSLARLRAITPQINQSHRNALFTSIYHPITQHLPQLISPLQCNRIVELGKYGVSR